LFDQKVGSVTDPMPRCRGCCGGGAWFCSAIVSKKSQEKMREI
jgi:hypothetical protein